MHPWIKANGRNVALAGAVLVVAAWSISSPPGARTATMPEHSKTASTLSHEKEQEKMSILNHAAGKVQPVNESNFGAVVLDADIPVLVDFYADWCGPCRMLGPVLEQLADEVTDAAIVKVNVDENPDLASRYRISSIPALKVFRGGEVVAEHVGMASKSQLKALLAK
jgi:thioredoxin 1